MSSVKVTSLVVSVAAVVIVGANHQFQVSLHKVLIFDNFTIDVN